MPKKFVLVQTLPTNHNVKYKPFSLDRPQNHVDCAMVAYDEKIKIQKYDKY